VTLLLSTEALSSSDVLDFFSPAEIALACLEHLLELAVLAAALTIAYTLVDEALRAQPRRVRLAVSCALPFGFCSDSISRIAPPQPNIQGLQRFRPFSLFTAGSPSRGCTARSRAAIGVAGRAFRHVAASRPSARSRNHDAICQFRRPAGLAASAFGA
jgi:hypothetical protein